jgi:hypothetical protein
MWRGLDQLELERRTIHIFSSALNSASAIRSLSGSRRRALAQIGLPFVSTECSTPCKGCGVDVPSLTMLGKEARRLRTGGEAMDSEATSLERLFRIVSPMGRSVLASKTLLVAESTRRRFFAKKSEPKIGLATEASTKGTSRKDLPPKQTVLSTLPQEEILLPSAPAKAGPEEETEEDDGECGITLTAAPVSTKKQRPDRESVRYVRPPRAFICSRRPPSFPHTCSLVCS